LGLGPISGAHFNPAVSLVMGATGALPWRETGLYVLAQALGGWLGTLAAHGMFDLALLQIAAKARTGPAQWFAEAVATFGLLATILSVVRFRIEAIPFAVGLYITAAYWFTASTSFANPAVTLARAFTDTFAGIAPANVPAFMAAQLAGAFAAMAVFGWLLRESPSTAKA
jgi:glycerol uptake facilitator-like aquaporin